MRRRILKWIGIVLGVLLGLVVIIAIALYLRGTAILNTSYPAIEAETITIPDDDVALARGAYLAAVICTECHRGDLGGSVPDDIFVDEPGIFTIYAANITTGEGGIGDLTDAELVKAIRHGIDQDDTHLIIMPAEVFVNWSAEDVGAVIAHLRQRPPIDNVIPEPQLGLFGSIMLGADMVGNLFPAAYLDHDTPFPEMPEIGVNAEYGQYLATAFACVQCHDVDMTGGLVHPALPPGEYPLPPNITLGGTTADWSDDDFLNMFRTGMTPDGREIGDEPMPMGVYRRFSDTDILAIWEYIKSLPAVEIETE